MNGTARFTSDVAFYVSAVLLSIAYAVAVALFSYVVGYVYIAQTFFVDK